ncbi:hypothetical protein [Streptomyces specialis]|uniref:hypothetical protein n=1 Tax=Streptomyces specialis TaxID=498367 RepID=UPI000AE12623|nr:hypothetical protein [Streptomyces specialis]
MCIRDAPGTAWYVDDVPTDVHNDLTPAERLFVNTWHTRHHPDHKPPDDPAR